jgi:hypothetical protein
LNIRKELTKKQQANFYPNDPAAADAPIQIVPYKIAKLRQKWTVQRGARRIKTFDPGTLGFQTGQINLTLSGCVGFWNKMFGDLFPGWSSTTRLLVIPRLDYRTYPDAENGFNAFYDRRNLAFFYDVDPATDETVYTSESLDIISHEAGHAVLDAIQPDFWNTLLPEIDAFHEAFGDCSSMLTTLQNESVRKAFLQIRNPLGNSNLVSRLAEEMGRGIFDTFGADAAPPDSLRDAINTFKYKDPSTLPSRGPDRILTRGSHSFARVFAGAFYGALVRVYELAANTTTSKDKALIEAIDSVGKVLAEAVLSTVATPFLFREVALNMLKADEHLFSGKYRECILNAFVEKNILSSIAAGSPRSVSDFQTATGAAKPLNTISLPERVQTVEGKKKLAEDITKALGITDSKRSRINVRRDPHTRLAIVQGSYPTFVKLDGREYDLPGEVEVYLPSSFALLLGEKKEQRIVASHAHVTDNRTVREARDYLQYLANEKKIYVPKKNEKRIDPKKLAAMHKPYYYSTKTKRILKSYYA